MTTSHHALLGLVFFVVGSCVGSFVNVCAYRIPRAMSLLRPRSRCPRCGTTIRQRDNIPILGWLILRGRCRACRGEIPARYPSVELAAGLLFCGVYASPALLSPRDFWEDAGPWRVLFALLASWMVIGLLMVGTLIALDRRSESRKLSRGPRIGGQTES